MENPIPITYLNDFIFCPVSIYFHSLDHNTDVLLYQDLAQINGTAAHSAVDDGRYTDRKTILQGISVYSDKYNLMGKIDIFDIEKGILTERKRTIKKIYDGYVFQIYAQYFALTEMGYKVNRLRFYSLSDNKIYEIDKPEANNEMMIKFEDILNHINNFAFEDFEQNNIEKCANCIYEPLCYYSRIKI